MQTRTLYFVTGCLSLLLIPFFAMQFQVSGGGWTGSDFGTMAVLLAGVGLALAMATNRAYTRSKRLTGAAIVAVLVLLYVNLAVGIVDTWPLAGS